ncbi:MAG: 2,3-bisphosphoglycerate-independent phosphoglycerate mutase [Anaerolineaceae bacterium]
MDKKFLQKLIAPSTSKIVMIIMDGLGGLPREIGGKTELETARTPNLDSLAERSALGLSSPAGPGITVGSGPGHLAIFGYDPIENEIGRGALEALGVDFDLGPTDVAARGNFCSIDSNGLVSDRRAGRIPTEKCMELAELLSEIKLEGIEFFIEPVKEHRFAFILRGHDLSDELSDTDPLKVGVPPLEVKALSKSAIRSAKILNEFIAQSKKILAKESPANMVMLRGFAKLPTLPTFTELYGLHAASIAVNGMYKGVSRLAGMDILDVHGLTIADEFRTLKDNWENFDFFYLHIKKTDTCGENGDFDGKVKVIEEVDTFIPGLMELAPDVVIVSGDHSSPAVLKSHSWHPVPSLLYSPIVRADGIKEFGERACSRGSLGVLPAKDIMLIALANSGRIAKYGA